MKLKDITISVSRQKIELKWVLSCLCAAFIVNVVAIILYKTSFTEIYTQIPWVLMISVFMYVFSGIVRIILYIIKRIVAR